jgi:hypothetical protein
MKNSLQTGWHSLINVVGLQVGWLACATGAAQGRPWLGPLVVAVYTAIHLRWLATDWRKEAGFIAAVCVLGFAVDGVMSGTSFLAYASPSPWAWLAPVWIVGMWALFASAFNHSLGWLQGRPGVAFALGSVFGPFSYEAGARLGGVTFLWEWELSMILLAVVWGVVTAVLAAVARKLYMNPA